MKIEINEYQAEFCISIEAENVAEASKLIRLGLLRTKTNIDIWARAEQSGSVIAGIQVSKSVTRSPVIEGDK